MLARRVDSSIDPKQRINEIVGLTNKSRAIRILRQLLSRLTWASSRID